MCYCYCAHLSPGAVPGSVDIWILTFSAFCCRCTLDADDRSMSLKLSGMQSGKSKLIKSNHDLVPPKPVKKNMKNKKMIMNLALMLVLLQKKNCSAVF